jgi:hypothetical protein
MAESHRDAQELERVLLRRGVGMIAAGRDRCADCGRSPLVGEQVHLYAGDGSVVCELCSVLRSGRPAASELVRHSEVGQTVRIMRAT